MRILFTLTALLAVTASADAFAKSAPSTSSILSNPNATRRISERSAPPATTQNISAATVRRDRDAEIQRIIDAAEERRRNSSVSP